MEILDDKYLPKDDLLNIVHNIEPKTILNFCSINKYTKNICRNNNFWDNYINEDQHRFNKLLLSVATEGATSLWEQLWINAKNYGVIREKKMIRPSFDQAVINGHDDTSDYIYTQLDEYDNKEAVKLEPLLERALTAENYKLSEYLLIEYGHTTNLKGKINKILAYAHSYDLLDYLRAIIYKENLFLSANIYIIYRQALYIGNINLVKQIWKIHPNYSRYNISVRNRFQDLIQTNNYNIFKLAQKRNPEFWEGLTRDLEDPAPWNRLTDIVIVNKNIALDLLKMIPQHDILILIISFNAFKPHEYVNLLKNYGVCLTIDEYERILNKMKEKGEGYRIKIFEDEVIICNDEEFE